MTGTAIRLSITPLVGSNYLDMTSPPLTIHNMELNCLSRLKWIPGTPIVSGERDFLS